MTVATGHGRHLWCHQAWGQLGAAPLAPEYPRTPNTNNYVGIEALTLKHNNGTMAFDEGDWANTAAAAAPTGAGVSDSSRLFVSEEFLDDFDDDDDAFFSSRADAGGASIATDPNTNNGVNKSVTQQSSGSSFGMVSLTYDDAVHLSSGSSVRGSSARPTSPTFGQADGAGEGLDGDDISDDAELLDVDQRYLTHLRNPSSSYRVVAKSCLALHQLVYCNDHSGNHPNATSLDSSQPRIQIETSCIYHIQRYQRLIHCILSSLTTCLTSHNSSASRSLASKTLATAARAAYARLRFDAKLTSVRLPPSIATRLEDECGNGAAYSLVVAAIEQGNDAVSSAALDALGRLTLDPHTDNLAAEVRGIAECSSTNVSMSENGSKSCWILEHSFAMREMQSKAWEHVVFPRMQNIVHRMSLYSSPHHLARTIPVVTAAFVHALTQGRDTMPSRRALQTSKVSHGKRGWREVDAEGLAKEYMEGILLPSCIANNNTSLQCSQSDKSLHRAVAAACIRMSSAVPNATWRLSACRHATTILLQQLNREMTLAPSSSLPTWKSSAKLEMANSNSDQAAKSASISSTLSTPAVPAETLAGTAAMLVIALRGVPVHERAPGLAAVLQAALLHLPLGVAMTSGAGGLDIPIATVESNGQTNHYRLGRNGLLTEVALCAMLDGPSNTNKIKLDEPSGDDHKIEAKGGTRAVLLQNILRSDQLALVLDVTKYKNASTFHPTDELLWAFISVAIQVGKEREQLFANDSASAVEWSNTSLVLLDYFAQIVSNSSHQSKSPFTNAGLAAYNELFTSVLKQCGSYPPSALSISGNILPNPHDHTFLVEGGPGKKLHRVASSLSKIATNILYLRDKSKHSRAHAGTLAEASSHTVRLTALLVDAWMGRCIMNHDAKQSNEAQLDQGLMFLPLCQSEVEVLLEKNRDVTDQTEIVLVAQLCRVLIALLEHVACMSELLAHDIDKNQGGATAASGKDVGPLAISALHGIINFAKEGAAAAKKQSSMLRYQVALDANDTIARITEYIRNIPQSYTDDLASAFQVSPLIESVQLDAPLSLPDHPTQLQRCVWFLYSHARLALMRQTDSAAKATATTSSASGVLVSSKLIKPRNALRLPTFSHSTIEMYQKMQDLPLLLPVQTTRGGIDRVETLTGSSDPVSLLMSHGIRRARKADNSEDAGIVISMRLCNTTPVPIRNGVRLQLNISNEGSTCTATSVYKHEIKAYDSVTWEITLGHWSLGNISLQASVTFLELDQESSTNRWISGGEPGEDQALPNEAFGDEEDSVSDITLPCKPVTISQTISLAPCPLVFFGGLCRCQHNAEGDSASFNLLWQRMNFERNVAFTLPKTQAEGGAIRTLANTNTGYVRCGTDALPAFGCAWVALDGSRILCTQDIRDGATHTLSVRADSDVLLESLLGNLTDQRSFLSFLFGPDAQRVESSQKLPTGHDFPSMTMKPGAGHDFPSMTMPHRRPVLT